MGDHDKIMENCDPEPLVDGKALGDLVNETLSNLLAPVAELEFIKRKDYWTEKEVSFIYSIPQETLRTERCRGRGPGYIKDGKRIFYPKRELIAYFERRLVKTFG